MLKDFFGREIKVGDYYVYPSTGYGRAVRVYLYKVQRLTKETLVLAYVDRNTLELSLSKYDGKPREERACIPTNGIVVTDMVMRGDA